MILSNEVEMQLGEKNHTFLKKKYNLDSNLMPGETFKITIDKLSKGSKSIVSVSCDYCGNILQVPYKRYNLSTKIVSKYACSSKDCSNQKIKDVCRIKYGVDNPFQSDFVKEKSKDTLNKKYGVEHPMFLEETKSKIKETCKEKYGVDNYMKTEECRQKIKNTNLEKYGVEWPNQTIDGKKKRKETRIRNGTQIPDELVTPYKLYRRLVDNKLDIIRSEFLNQWDGYDYYDGEYIKDNIELGPKNRLYPTIDHKVSVYFGFINDISVENISDVSNLCVTKSCVNSRKRDLNEDEFLIKYKIKKVDA